MLTLNVLNLVRVEEFVLVEGVHAFVGEASAEFGVATVRKAVAYHWHVFSKVL